MPIVLEHPDLSGRYSLAVWDSTEELEELYPLQLLEADEFALYSTFTSASRQREFLTVRRIVRELNGRECKISYDANGRPSLGNNGYLSISHSGRLVAVIQSKANEVGIDIETLRENMDKIAPKFISADEYVLFGEQLTNTAMHVIWGAKEVLFKMYGKGDVDFKKDLRVTPAEVGSHSRIQAEIRKVGFHRSYEMSFQRLQDAMLVWACSDPSVMK